MAKAQGKKLSEYDWTKSFFGNATTSEEAFRGACNKAEIPGQILVLSDILKRMRNVLKAARAKMDEKTG